MRPMNGDTNLQEIVRNIVNINNIDVIIETGTHVGWSTGFFSSLVPKVITTEISEKWQSEAKKNLVDYTNIEFILGDSAAKLPDIINPLIGKRVLFFLDSHFNNDKSLDRELEVIKNSKVIPYILIHDFKVPNRPDLGYDTWDGHEYSFESFEPLVESVYRAMKFKGYKHYYNNTSEYGQRGCLILEPVI